MEILPHLEQELRYVRPAGFEPPERLGKLEHVGASRAVHQDSYCDGRDRRGRPALRRRGASLRLRRQGPQQALVTLKTRGEPQTGPATVRQELEAPLYGPAAERELLAVTLQQLEHPVLQEARRLAGSEVVLVELFVIVNDRSEHRYRASDGSELVLCEDRVLYPDGSHEQRLELELVRGSSELLERVDRRLRRRYPELTLAERGKQGEARRRLIELLDL